MADHKVVTRRESRYPFKPYWLCVCGTRFSANVMGPTLYKEFQLHLEEKA